MDMKAESDNWLPLESNPEVMNPYAEKIGINTKLFSFQDLLGFEEWAFEMIQKPVIGVVFNFPIKPNTSDFNKAEKERIEKDGQQVGKVFFMKQLAHNACGSIAMMHVVVNASEQYPELVVSGSSIAEFMKLVEKQNPQEAGETFKKASQLKQAHIQAVQEGQSQLNEEVDRHFIAFILKDGFIYELDGQKDYPINHGASNNDMFLTDVSVVIKKFFERDPHEVSFSTVVLAKALAE